MIISKNPLKRYHCKICKEAISEPLPSNDEIKITDSNDLKNPQKIPITYESHIEYQVYQCRICCKKVECDLCEKWTH